MILITIETSVLAISYRFLCYRYWFQNIGLKKYPHIGPSLKMIQFAIFDLRGITERNLIGLPDLISLDMDEITKSLGQGYDIGYFNFNMFHDRRDNCVIPKQHVMFMQNQLDEIKGVSNRAIPTLEFMDTFNNIGYHEAGHDIIANACGGPMLYSEASARDPIFWRWHKQISDVLRNSLNILHGNG